MKALTTKQNILYRGKEVIKTFQMNIEKILILGDNIVLLLETESLNDNVICVDVNGNERWVVETFEYHNKICPATNIYLKESNLYLYRRCGMEEEINIDNGKILSSELIK